MRRVLLRFTLTIGISLLFIAPATAQPERTNSECSEQSEVAAKVCEKTLGEKIGEFVESPGKYVAREGVESLTKFLADGAIWLTGKAVNSINESVKPELGADWFQERYKVMLGLAALVMVPMLMMSVIRAVMQQDLNQLLKSFLMYLPIAILIMFIATQIVQASLVVTDGLSDAVSKNIGNDVSAFYSSINDKLSSFSLGAPGLPLFGVFIVSVLLILGALFVWIELLVRSAAVYVAVLFLPLVLAALVWPAASKWCRRLVETLAAVIVSKFIIVAVLALAAAALNAGAAPTTEDAGFGTVMSGSVLMLLAAFSPFVLLKLMPAIESAASNHLESASRKPGVAVQRGGHYVYQDIIKSKLASEKGRVATAAAATGGASVPLNIARAAGNGATKVKDVARDTAQKTTSLKESKAPSTGSPQANTWLKPDGSDSRSEGW